MEWELGALVSFCGRAYVIHAIVVNRETGATYYTLNNADLRYEWLTVCRKA